VAEIEVETVEPIIPFSPTELDLALFEAVNTLRTNPLYFLFKI
jgi:hypothetical protein